MDVEQEHEKTYYDCSRYGPSYKVGKEVLVFNPTLKIGETRKFNFFYRRPNTIVEIKNNLNLKWKIKTRGKLLKSILTN